MKIGALDYLMKPFDPEKIMPMVIRIYQDMVAGQDEEHDVGVIILPAVRITSTPHRAKTHTATELSPMWSPTWNSSA